MSDASERWYELSDAEALGEPLSDDDRALLREHADLRELALFGDIERLADEEPPRDDDRARAEATLQRFRASASTGRRAARVAGLALVVAAAAAVLVWIAMPRAHDVFEARVSSGGFLLAGDALAPGAEVPGGVWIAAGEGACLELADARACFEPGSELRVVEGAIELRGGSLRVESGKVIVRDDGGPVTLHAGEERGVESTPPVEPPPAEVVAVRPSVADEAPAPTVAAVEPEPAAEARKPLRRALPTEPASKMLADARALANAGDLAHAITAYDALRRAHPDSADAHAANVSIGQLQLRRSKNREALAAFERYLRRGGGLAEEAHWGRVQALHRLGRTAATDRAVDQLLAAHPRSVYADDARALRSR